MCRFLEKQGFIAVRQSGGSHRSFKHPDGRTTIVGIHSGDMKRPIIRKILKDIGVSIDEYNEKT
jgi:predicted RNA binding protein YcfA (HicA-like mRNA interferase family)